MATLNEIKHRISGVKSTQKITRAMKVVATTRLKKYENLMKTGKEYLKLLEEVFGEIARSDKLDHPLMTRSKKEGKTAIILISSDRGLCGSFNSMLFRETDQYLQKKFGNKQLQLFFIGLKGEQYYKKTKHEIVYKPGKLSDEDRMASAKNVIDEIALLYKKKRISEVYVIYNHYASRSKFGFKSTKILPFDVGSFMELQNTKKGVSFLVEPSISECLEVLIPLYLDSFLRDALLQSHMAEELSRMLAMDYATENANELIGELTLIYNRTRQEVITKEISEIVGGAEALK